MTAGRSGWDRWPITKVGAVAQVILCIAHIGTMATGLVLFIRPSPSIQRELDPLWQAAWSAIFIIFGPLALVFRLKRAWVYEAICLIATAGGLMIWGAVSMYATTGPNGTLNSLQVATRLIVGGLLLTGFAFLEIEWVRLRRTAPPAVVDALSRAIANQMRGGQPDENR